MSERSDEARRLADEIGSPALQLETVELTVELAYARGDWDEGVAIGTEAMRSGAYDYFPKGLAHAIHQSLDWDRWEAEAKRMSSVVTPPIPPRMTWILTWSVDSLPMVSLRTSSDHGPLHRWFQLSPSPSSGCSRTSSRALSSLTPRSPPVSARSSH